MSGDSFITRWSRMKQRAADDKRKPGAGSGTAARQAARADAEQATAEERAQGRALARSTEGEPVFDPATLPPIESIVAGTDIRAFLQKGVPAALTKAALRRAWTTDPAIRDFIEVAENQWDFTDPASIPGFGPLQAADSVPRMVEQALGNLPQAADTPAAAGTAAQGSDPGVTVAADAPPKVASAGPPAMHAQVVGAREEESDNPDTAGVAALQHPDSAHQAGNMPRRKGHGRAMPR
jgi:uncharacterized protein DUF3306